ncbi:MAG: TonB-dependent receptor [Bacteroidetes bacterium]|nr:TonB-dependent receptor [Bacteroidota bacterium]
MARIRTYRIVLTVLLFFSLVLQAQVSSQKKIVGKVIDAETGEPIIGANVYLEGTTRGASTDLEGSFVITGVQEGTYTIIVSALSYGKKKIPQFTVTDASVYTLNIQLKPETIKSREVVVEGAALMSYEGVLLKQRKNAATVSDGVSADQMKKAPDVTSGEALRRLTGISLVDNKYVFVRGITDRYNQAILNGTTLASLEADKRSFSFDILPANLLENIVVVKSATPELRGDFTGGLVQLNTLDFPEKRTIKLSLGTSYNTLTTFRATYRSQSNTLDWLGIDDGGRELPSGFTNTLELAQKLPNTWSPVLTKAPANVSFSISYGDVFSFDDENSQLGIVTALTYRSNYQRNERSLNDVTLGRTSVGVRNDYSVLWGALANISAKFSRVHKVSFKNTFNHSGEDQVGKYVGTDLNTSLENQYTILQWSQRSVYAGQLVGEHYFENLAGISLDWKIYTSVSDKKVPDRKEVTYYRDKDVADEPYQAAVNKRSWSVLNDRNTGGSFDFTYPIANAKIKVGTLLERRLSTFRIRYFDVTPDYYGGIPTSMVQLPLSEIYRPEHYGYGKFLFTEVSKPSDRYTGNQNLEAVYGMADVPVTLFGDMYFRVVGGIRVEQSVIKVRIPRSLSEPIVYESNELKDVDILPSVNITYAITPAMNIRGAYSRTVNRPEFREIAKTGFYDFIRYEIVGGNPNLQSAKANNYDLRVEYFPQAGELIAASVFRKEITNAIEEQLLFTSTRTRTWFNSPKAVNEGWEFELRKGLGFIAKYLDESNVTVNYTRVYSAVSFTTVEGNSQSTRIVHAKRTMQGQSPYVINVSIFFSEPTYRTSFNILYNKFGRRLDAVGFLAADVYEEARETIDATVSQPLQEGLELKIGIKNLTGSKREYTREKLPFEVINVGRSYSLQLSYTL